MNELPLLARIKRIFFRARPQNAEAPAPIRQIVGALSMTEDEELSCDEVFRLLDQFAELRAAGENPAIYFPLVEKHLEKCMDCREEYEAVLVMLGVNGQLSGLPA